MDSRHGNDYMYIDDAFVEFGNIDSFIYLVNNWVLYLFVLWKDLFKVNVHLPPSSGGEKLVTKTLVLQI